MISSLLFADDVVVLALSDQELQHALGRFAAECEAAGMRISTSKSEAMVLSRKKVACLLQVGGEFLPQVEEFKYLGVLFTSEGRMEREIDRQIGAASAVMRSLYRSVVVKKELSRKAKLLIYRSIYVPTLTYGHELRVMTERTRSWIQAAEMSFFRRVAGQSLRDRLVKMEPLTAANTQFSLNLFKEISGGNASGNVFYSPVSISSALAMVSLGERGNTADQMIKVLGFNNPPVTGQKPEDQIHSSFNKFMSELNKPGVPYVLSLANRLYGEQSYQFVEKFLNDAKSYYEAGLEKVDFNNQSEAARVNINQWVETKTQEKIKDLVPQGVIDEMTKLILVNAIYFKGNWEKKFKEKKKQRWANQIKPVKMMYQKAKFPLAFIPEINSQVLELPYVGKNLSMLIILPNEMEDDTTGLQKLEKALTYEKLMEWTKPEVMCKQEVKVSLPRFKMEEKYDMKSLLISMGMEDVFDPQKVNLSGMSSNNDLVMSKVIHKAFVEVNEEGTEAAAATVVMVENCYIKPQFFNADQPFLFFIRHNPTKSILFYGRFCLP
ncbi:hypothetical protein PO909_008816 [Leuciscus waleckii]